MVVKGEDSDEFIFHVSMADKEVASLSKDGVSAATEALEFLYEEYGGSLLLSPTIKTVNVSKFLEYFDVDFCEEYHYTPEVLSNAGLHELAKKMKETMGIYFSENEED